MTETLTTAEVRLAATTNEDLPLTQYKKLEKGFDAWLEAVKAEAVRAALVTVEPKSQQSKNSSRSAKASLSVKDEPKRSAKELTPEKIASKVEHDARKAASRRRRGRKPHIQTTDTIE